jgi:hypothetical protein
MPGVDTDESDSNVDDNGTLVPREAESRLAVLGFRDTLLGCYWHDALTTSRLAQALLQALAGVFGMISALGDVKNAYFDGRQLQCEV